MTPLETYLSLDIVFTILVHLPADILYHVMRFVCRDWYNIVSGPQFIDAHLTNTERGLLINQHSNWIRYVDGLMKNKCDDDTLLRIQTVKLGRTNDKPHFVGTSCNGLVVTYDYKSYTCYVENSVTKEIITLPPRRRRRDTEFHISISMGYIRLSKKYKVVLFYKTQEYELECEILTLGVDKEWRSLFEMQLYTDRINGTFGYIEFLCSWMVCTEGMLHVLHDTLPSVFSIDLETEIYYTRETPKRPEKNKTTYMGNGRSLCFMDTLGRFSWEIWLLKDPVTGDWTKMATVDLGPQEKMLRQTLCPLGIVLLPVGFLKDGEIVVFYVVHENGQRENNRNKPYLSRNYITYNVKTGGCINRFQCDRRYFCEPDEWRYIPHVKSLVSPKSLYG